MLYIPLLLSFIGLVVALYGYALHMKVKQNPFYKPFCDISNLVSCTRTIKSPYSTFLGFPFAMYAALFYAVIFILSLFNAVSLIFLLSLAASILSVVLAVFCYMKLNAVCPLCVVLYIINFLLLFNTLPY